MIWWILYKAYNIPPKNCIYIISRKQFYRNKTKNISCMYLHFFSRPRLDFLCRAASHWFKKTVHLSCQPAGNGNFGGSRGVEIKQTTPRKFNSSPLKRVNPKRKLIFQSSFFRGYVILRVYIDRFYEYLHLHEIPNCEVTLVQNY